MNALKLSGALIQEGLMPFSVELLIEVTGQVALELPQYPLNLKVECI